VAAIQLLLVGRKNREKIVKEVRIISDYNENLIQSATNGRLSFGSTNGCDDSEDRLCCR